MESMHGRPPTRSAERRSPCAVKLARTAKSRVVSPSVPAKENPPAAQRAQANRPSASAHAPGIHAARVVSPVRTRSMAEVSMSRDATTSSHRPEDG